MKTAVKTAVKTATKTAIKTAKLSLPLRRPFQPIPPSTHFRSARAAFIGTTIPPITALYTAFCVRATSRMQTAVLEKLPQKPLSTLRSDENAQKNAQKNAQLSGCRCMK